MSVANEQELIEAIRDGLPAVNVTWGFAEFESATSPPSLPLVCVTRVSASVQTDGGPLADMCDTDEESARTIIQIDSWENGYEDARTLNEQVHTIVAALIAPSLAPVWSWESDVDHLNPQLKAWNIQSTWTTDGER